MTTVDLVARLLPSLGLIVGALLMLRHWARRGAASHGAGSLSIVTRTGVTKGAVVAVVAVGGRRLLVGASEHGVTLLTHLDDVDDVEGVATGAASTSTAAIDDICAAAPPSSAGTATTHAPTPGEPTRPPTMDLLEQIRHDRPRMAPTDRLRRLTVRQAVPSHPRRPKNGAHPPT